MSYHDALIFVVLFALGLGMIIGGIAVALHDTQVCAWKLWRSKRHGS